MTVAEFIKELEKYNPDAEILTYKEQYYSDVEETDTPEISTNCFGTVYIH